MMGSFLCYFLLLTLNSYQIILSLEDHTVFQPPQEANRVFQRSKRANMFYLEEMLKGNLERECFEERCSREEARECFENDQKTEEFWNKYYDGDQCRSNPCKHGGTCRDLIGGYSCKCTEMYGGVNCDTDVSQCPTEGPLGCEHFCRPTDASYRCFCAQGYKLHSNKRNCLPHVQNPCGISENFNQTSGGSNIFCPDGRCSWEVKFVKTDGDVVCHGVMLGQRSVLTSAVCMSMLKDLNITLILAGRHSNVSLQLSSWTPHKRFVSGQLEDNLAFLVLKESIPPEMGVIPLCLPEKDYSENILMRNGREGVVMGGAGHNYLSLDDCRESLNLTFLMTNKMFCMKEQTSGVAVRSKLMREHARCEMKSGSPVATVEGKTAFLTGISLSGGDCKNGLVFTKLSRYLHWIRPLQHAAEHR